MEDWEKIILILSGIVIIASLIQFAYYMDEVSYKEYVVENEFRGSSAQIIQKSESLEGYSTSIVDDCTNNPEQYKKWKGINRIDCYDCYIENIYGTSMTPTLKSGYAYVFEKWDIRSKNIRPLQKGDIIEYDRTYEQTNVIYNSTFIMIIHRIVDFQDNDLVVLGDNNTVCELIPQKAVIGILVGETI